MQEDQTIVSGDEATTVNESAPALERHAHRYSRSSGPDGHVITPDQRDVVDIAASLVLGAGAHRLDAVLFHDGSAMRWNAPERRWDVTAVPGEAIPGHEGRTAAWDAEASHWAVTEPDGSDALPAHYRQELTHGRR